LGILQTFPNLGAPILQIEEFVKDFTAEHCLKRLQSVDYYEAKTLIQPTLTYCTVKIDNTS